MHVRITIRFQYTEETSSTAPHTHYRYHPKIPLLFYSFHQCWHTKPNNDNLRYFFRRLDFSFITTYCTCTVCTLYLLRVMNKLDGPLSYSSALSLQGEVHVGARALLDINLIWYRFSYIAHLSQWGGGGCFTRSNDFCLPSLRLEEGEGASTLCLPSVKEVYCMPGDQSLSMGTSWSKSGDSHACRGA